MRNDQGLYERHAADWWNRDSRWFRSLHRVHDYRAELLRRWVPGPLAGQRVADLGCGGGLFCETLARAGAAVIGIDRSAASLRAARRAANEVGPARHYLQASIDAIPLGPGTCDGVLLADVLEHVPEPARVVQEAARVVREGGWVYVNTINRTRRAHLLAVTLAESLRLIPPGTHDPRLFIRPDELRAAAAAAGLRQLRILGERPRLLATLRSWAVCLRATADLSVAYSALFQKLPAPL